MQVREKVDAGAVTLDKFVIHKQLTKRPEDYPDAKNQPHVQVALRRAAAHKRDGTKQVPFPLPAVFCGVPPEFWALAKAHTCCEVPACRLWG